MTRKPSGAHPSAVPFRAARVMNEAAMQRKRATRLRVRDFGVLDAS